MAFPRTVGPALVFLSLLVTLLPACGGGGTPEPTSRANQGPSDQPRIIKIGNHTDLTRVPSNATIEVAMALEDIARYYNENELIPGVEFEIITYDGQYNPARDVPGYQYLISEGADFIFTTPPRTAVSLRPLADRDRLVVFTTSATRDAIDPPGWVFGLGGPLSEYMVYTLLDWLPQNDPDFPSDGPAQIGGAFWEEAGVEATLEGARSYCMSHPSQYNWVYGELTETKLSWGPEVAALEDCDYVFPNPVMASFAREYRQAGGKAKFLGTSAPLLFIDQIDAADLWDEIDGSLFVLASLWRNDEGEIIDFLLNLLEEYRPSQVKQVFEEGIGYGIGQQIYVMFKLIEETVAEVGLENFSSEALYETAQSFSIIVDGYEHSYSKTKRISGDSVAIYEARASEADIFRLTDWIPVMQEP